MPMTTEARTKYVPQIYLRITGGGLSTVNLLLLTRLDQLLMVSKTLYTFYKTSYHNEEVNRTEPSPSVSVPWRNQ
jgi:hypothetical protein